MKGTPSKIKFFRKMGVHIGENTEIMQGVWLDHFRPELIFIGDNTLIGAFSRVTVHAYEGHGRFRYGLVEIGNNCRSVQEREWASSASGIMYERFPVQPFHPI